MSLTGGVRSAYPGVMEVSRTTPQMLDALVAAMRGQVIEGIRIHAGTVRIRPGSEGEPVVALHLIIDDPVGDTWPVSAMQAMQRRALERAAGLGVEEWVSVTHAPVSHVVTTTASVL
jgi:hypothetical protein